MTKQIFISGGAGFIGSNIANRYLKNADKVIIFDNLSRKGTENNLLWLKKEGGRNLTFINGDIRDLPSIKQSLKGSDIVFHEAAQVAVTTSLINPIDDFNINALGTLNMLEAARQVSPDAAFIYASTNKVYGELSSKGYKEMPKRYLYNNDIQNKGVTEDQPLNFHSPYGCSKGSGDQYVRDYARVFGLKTVVFRQSCIYGQRQLGNEDQGWVMHFTKSIIDNKPLTIFGDGKQVRDILYVDDLIDAYFLAIEKINEVNGEIFNIGGGPNNSISLLELIELLEKILKIRTKYTFENWREGDQQIYITNISKAQDYLSWKPTINSKDGVSKLINWAKSI